MLRKGVKQLKGMDITHAKLGPDRLQWDLVFELKKDVPLSHLEAKHMLGG